MTLDRSHRQVASSEMGGGLGLGRSVPSEKSRLQQREEDAKSHLTGEEIFEEWVKG